MGSEGKVNACASAVEWDSQASSLFRGSRRVEGRSATRSVLSLAEVFETEQPDPAARFRALSRSCSAGYATGCFWTAAAYAEGQGVTKDPQKAVDLFDRSCASGNDAVCESFASELRQGNRIPKDLERALKLQTRLCEKAVAAGERVAAGGRCQEVAELDAKLGRNDEAFKFSKRACEVGADPSFCIMKAKVQESGKGTKKDPAAAHAFFKTYCGDEMNKAGRQPRRSAHLPEVGRRRGPGHAEEKEEVNELSGACASWHRGRSSPPSATARAGAPGCGRRRRGSRQRRRPGACASACVPERRRALVRAA